MPARSAPLSSTMVAIPSLRLNGDVLSFISTTMISARRSISRCRNWRWRRSSSPTNDRRADARLASNLK
jgi:hypothetical protein